MPQALMRLKVLLPFQVFADKANVKRIVADTLAGSCGLLPHRQDCVAALVPGIFIYQCEGGDEVYTAIDEGILVKTGLDVFVSVRRALAGDDLSQLRDVVQKDYLTLTEDERTVRTVVAKMESTFIRQLAGLHHG